MEELKRQLIEAVAALDAHDEETKRLLTPVTTISTKALSERDVVRTGLVYAVAGVARSLANYWKAEAKPAPCRAEFAGHVCDVRGPHDTHEDGLTLQRWPVSS